MTSALLTGLLLALQVTSTRALPTSIWHISILESPAPPPDQGPPLSAGALRDKSKLPAEIGGIVGAYCLCAAVALLLTFIVGRRLRRRAETSNRSLSMEMVKPRVDQAALGVGLSPDSPVRMWPSPTTTTDVHTWTSPSGHHYQRSLASVSTFDETVVEADRAKGQSDLERLYAAVMAHDDQKSRKEPTISETEQVTPTSLRQYPTEFQHLRNQGPKPQTLSHPLAPSPVEHHPEHGTTSRASSRFSRTPLPFLSSVHSRASSANSNKTRPQRISIRGQPISSPIGSPDLAQSVAYNDEQPLSPRLYAPGPPPAIPENKSLAAPPRDGRGLKRAPVPAPLSTRSATNSSNMSLPFRQYTTPLQSAPSTKTTFLERRESKLHTVPRTGVPSTPYSPYMPFTPITPITPGRLVTKEERKRNQKKNGLKVLVEDDLVKNDEDMWQ